MMSNTVSEFIVRFADPLISSAALVLLVMLVYLALSHGIRLLQQRHGITGPVVGYSRKMLRAAGVLAAVLLVLQSFDLLRDAWTTLTAMLAMVAIGFVAVWSVLSNALCSVIMLLARPFRVGDQIEIPPDMGGGTVVNFNMLFTILRTEDDRFIQIPNNMFFQRIVIRNPGKGDVQLEEQLFAKWDAEPKE